MVMLMSFTKNNRKNYFLIYSGLALAVIVGTFVFCALYFGRPEKEKAVLPPEEEPAIILNRESSTTQTQIILATTTPEGKRFQYVALAFDGSRSLDAWRESLSFAKSMSASGTPVHFTYFINAIYFITAANKKIYHPPHYQAGTSFIGYGSSSPEIGERIAFINTAYQHGHEIASHGVGHIPGVGWALADWISELTQFDALLSRARRGADTTVPLSVPVNAIRGFRAPGLVQNRGLQLALDHLGYEYDASQVSSVGVWPKRVGNHWELSLASIPFRGHSIISMDYNFYMKDTLARNILKKDSPQWKADYNEVLNAYLKYFDKSYTTDRAPVFIGNHFSFWNDSLYFDVLKEFAREVCVKPYVRCANYQEVVAYLNQISK